MVIHSRLLAFCFLMAATACYSQSAYNRILTGFTYLSGGKTEWIDVDSDNDLDLLSVGSDGSATLTVVYENVAGTLTQRVTNLPAMSAFASADYDGDGDSDLLAFHVGTPFTKLYRNDGGFNFSEVTSFGAFAPGSAIWLDIDNDEDLDFLLAGNISTPRLFENTGTGFTELESTIFPDCPGCNADVADVNGDGLVDIVFTGGVTSLYLNAGNKVFNPGADTFKQTTLGDVACGDFDGDGDFDILLTGLLNNAPYTAIYENTNNQLVERRDLGLSSVVTTSSSGLLWFNNNNDGKIDIFLSGSVNLSNAFASFASVFRNNTGSFTDIMDGYIVSDRYMGSYDAGDFDNDGDVDLAFQGTKAVLEGDFNPKAVIKRYAGFYRQDNIQQAAVSNTKPLPPGLETFSETMYRNEIRLKWGDGSDAETPDAGLFYNFYLRDASKKLIVPSVNFSNGNIHTNNAPNGTGKSGYAFNMPEGELYYAVQSIDGAKTGSVFSAEKMFYHINGPEALEAAFTDQEHVNLSWIDQSSLETNYEIFRSTSPGSGYTSVGILPADTEAYTDNFTFATETKYYYRVRGYNANASLYDSLVLVIPNRATNIVAQAVNASKINLSWNDQSQYETAYIVERKQGSGNFTVVATLGANVVQFADTQLADGTTYVYRVVAQGVNGALEPIATASVTTNARPDGLPFEVIQDEDKTLILSSDEFNNHFSDADASDHLVKIRIVSLPANGTLYLYTSPAVIGQEITPELLDFLEFKPSLNFAGTTTFKVLPYDGRDYGDTDWIVTLTFTQKNDPPVFDMISGQPLNEDFTGTVTVPVSRHYFPGEEGQIIQYTLSPQTNNVVDAKLAADGNLLLTSLPNKYGQVEFTIAADDGQSENNTYSRKIKVTIAPLNDPPVFAPIQDVLAESSPVTIPLDITDPDDDFTLSRVSAQSFNNTIVKTEKIHFSESEDGQITMSIIPEENTGQTNISVNIHDGGYYVSRQFKLTLMITGLEESRNEVIVFPNPVTTDLQIERIEGIERLTFVLRDVRGTKVQSGIVDTLTARIDLSQFAPGLYFLEMSSGNRTINTRRIIKQ